MSEDGEEFKAAMLDRAMDEGYFVQFVDADQASVLHLGKPYAYTVGRSMFGRPEFLVTGLERDEAQALLDGLVVLDDEGPQARPAFMLNGETWRVGDTVVKLIEATPAVLLGALTTFGHRVEAVQALWPRDGSYPSANDRWEDQPIHPEGVTPLTDGDPYA